MMERWNKIENSVEELIKSNCSINEFKAKVLTSAILDLLLQEGLVQEDPVPIETHIKSAPLQGKQSLGK